MTSRSRRWILVLAAAGATMWPVGASAQTATEEWVARYNDSTGNGDSEIARDIAVDGNGNVYVTGETYHSPGPGQSVNYATVKYGANGNERWTATYHGGDPNGIDRAYAVAVDAAGNVFVTGGSNDYRGYGPGAGPFEDIATIMYDSNGSERWVNRYNSPAWHHDVGHDITVDDAGNVYVTGESFTGPIPWNPTSYDYVTIKHDPTTGYRVWVATYDGPGRGIGQEDDSAQAIAVDAAGHVYVTGTSDGSADEDYATIKYRQDGRGPTAKWIQYPDLTSNGIDVNATSNGTDSFILADDFECTEHSAITKIDIWSSWLNDELPDGDEKNVAFTLSIHADIPGTNGFFSKPGSVLWSRTFHPQDFGTNGNGTWTAGTWAKGIEEGWLDPDNPFGYMFPADTVCWKYSFFIDLEEAFRQQGTPDEPVVYWLDVQAAPDDPNALFGWKTSVDHWNDDAVWGDGQGPYSGPWSELVCPPAHPLAGQSIDLAFALTASRDCNSNGVPDEDETFGSGDYDTDGDVDLDDYRAFEDCLAGPEKPPEPQFPECVDACLNAFDWNDDDDVDVLDFADFQVAFTG